MLWLFSLTHNTSNVGFLPNKLAFQSQNGSPSLGRTPFFDAYIYKCARTHTHTHISLIKIRVPFECTKTRVPLLGLD